MLFRSVKEEPIKAEEKITESMPVNEEKREIRYIGHAFNTYIIAEAESEIYFIDKHAAHERIIFDELKENREILIQELLSPITITLTKEEYSAVIGNIDTLMSVGFDAEDFGSGTVIIRAVPSVLKNEDISLLISEIAETLTISGSAEAAKVDDILHTVACKAAIKGNRFTTDFELKALAEKVLGSDDVMYCPHGRPVAFKLTRRELEKYFGRTGSVGL